MSIHSPAMVGETSPSRALIWVLVAGALARLALWSWFTDLPIRVSDELEYNTLAINLLERHEFAYKPGQPTSLRPPLYPAVVAGVYSVFGLESFQAVRLLQALMGLATAVAAWHLAAEIGRASCRERV